MNTEHDTPAAEADPSIAAPEAPAVEASAAEAPAANDAPPAEIESPPADAPPVEAAAQAVEAAPTPDAPVAAGDGGAAAAGDAVVAAADVADAAPAAEAAADGARAAKGAARGRPRRPLGELVIGEKLKGKVVGLSKFGAFVDIGATTDGLVHLTELPGKRVRTAEEAVQSGQSVEVFVKEVDLEKGRISLSMREPVARPMGGLSVGDVVTGQVTSITKYGAFVDIGSDTEGLVHISEMSSGFVSRPEDVVQSGAEVEVRIKEIDAGRKRISLSMVGLASDAAAGAEAERGDEAPGGRGRGRGREREREEEVEVPEEPAVRMPTVVELALRRAMGEDVDADLGERGKGRGDKAKKAPAREMSDVYAKMLAEYRDSKGGS